MEVYKIVNGLISLEVWKFTKLLNLKNLNLDLEQALATCVSGGCAFQRDAKSLRRSLGSQLTTCTSPHYSYHSITLSITQHDTTPHSITPNATQLCAHQSAPHTPLTHKSHHYTHHSHHPTPPNTAHHHTHHSHTTQHHSHHGPLSTTQHH